MNTSIRLTLFVLLSLASVTTQECFAQDKATTRVEVIRNFVTDLQSGKPNEEIYKEYLSSRGRFTNDTIQRTINWYTKYLRQDLQSLDSRDIAIYKYTDRPEKGRKLQRVEEPASEVPEYLPLEFSIDTPGLAVDIDDLYVFTLADGRNFVLFGKDGKIVTYFGLQWGHRIGLVGF